MSGGIVYDSLFVNNGVAVSSYSNWGPTVSNCIILGSILGVQVGYGASVAGGWICGQLPGVSPALIRQTTSADSSVSGVWFGISPDNVDLIRGSIIDEYWDGNLGLVNFGQLPRLQRGQRASRHILRRTLLYAPLLRIEGSLWPALQAGSSPQTGSGPQVRARDILVCQSKSRCDLERGGWSNIAVYDCSI